MATTEAKPTVSQGLNRRAVFGIVGAYTALSALWVLLSDLALSGLVHDAKLQTLLGTLKGWLFIAATSALLYFLLRRAARPEERAVPSQPPGGGAVLGLVVGVMLLITAAGIGYTVVRERQAAEAQVLTITRLRQQQIASWLDERHRDIRFYASGLESALAGAAPEKRRLAVEAWLDRLQWPHFVVDVLWLDVRGKMLWFKPDGIGGEAPRDLEAKIAEARRDRSAVSLGPDLDASQRLQMHFLIPLSDASLLLVKADITDWLHNTLSYWPLPTATGESVLLRQEGGLIRFLSRTRFGQALPETMALPIDMPNLLSARVLRGEAKAGVPLAARDYRGEPVFGLVEPIRGSDWWLLTKLDRSEMYGRALADSLVLLLAGLLGTLGLTAALRLAQQRQRLQWLALTQERQAQRLAEVELLADARARLQVVFDGIGDGIVLLDRHNRRIIDCNAALCEMLGRREAELMTLPLDALHPEPLRERVMSLYAAQPGCKRRVEADIPLLRADGSVLIVDIGIAVIDFGAQQLLVGIFRDTSDRQAATAALRASEERFRLLFDAVPAGIYVHNAETGAVLAANRQALRIHGCDSIEQLNQNDRWLPPPYSRAEVADWLQRAIAEGPQRFEWCNLNAAGATFWTDVSLTPMVIDGVRRVMAVSIDITERKRMAAELDSHRDHLEGLVRTRTAELDEARLKAETASRAKSDFLANMSHEIRTPMNAILGLTHLLRRESPTPQQAERLEKVDQAGQHLLGLLNDILDLSKIEAGKLELESRDFSCAALLDEVQSMLRESARRKGLSVTAELVDVPEWLRGDATRLRQALLNFASNAVKFTDTGSITLRARLLSQDGASAAAPARRYLVRFEVVDTGIGIAPEVAARLFHPFEQADASTTRKYGGSGLGLAITRRLAELMGGETGIASKLGAGSTFWFSAWLQAGVSTGRSDAAAHDVAQHLRMEYSGQRVLLAEDNPINQEIAVDLLSAVGLEVEVAGNGREALQRLTNGDYALVLMDMQMPELDGLGATRAIRADPRHARLPILAMTANAFDEDRCACAAAGMDDFVAKPVRIDDLYAAVLRCLQGKSELRTATFFAAGGLQADSSPHPSDDATTLSFARLAALPRFDAGSALAVARGDKARYLSLLERFLAMNRDAGSRLRDYVGQHRADEARRLAHTLKGTGATLGAHGLSAAVQELERELGSASAGGMVEPRILLVEEQLQQLADAVSAAQGSTVVEPRS